VLARLPGVRRSSFAAQRGIVAATRGVSAWVRGFPTHTDILYVRASTVRLPSRKDEPFIDTIRLLDKTSTWTVGICTALACSQPPSCCEVARRPPNLVSVPQSRYGAELLVALRPRSNPRLRQANAVCRCRQSMSRSCRAADRIDKRSLLEANATGNRPERTNIRGGYFGKRAKRHQAETPRVGGDDAALRRDELRLHTRKPRQHLVATDASSVVSPSISRIESFIIWLLDVTGPAAVFAAANH